MFMFTLRVDLRIYSRAQLERLVTIAIKRGFQRSAPTLRWTETERREAARYAVAKLVEEAAVMQEREDQSGGL